MCCPIGNYFHLTLSILKFTPHPQSDQVSSSEDFPGRNYEDNDSHNTPPQVDKVADPLFKPVFSLRTQDIVDSQTSNSWALNIIYFFVVHGTDKKKQWVCKICRYVLTLYAHNYIDSCILVRNIAFQRFQKACQITFIVYLPDF
jgi:hypothetical protein